MTVPYAFANLSGNIALAKLDANFNTPITIGNTSVLLGNTVTTLNNLTLANVTITSGTSNVTNVNVTNVTVINLTATLANVTTLNVASAYVTSANIGTLALTNALPVSSGGTGQVTFPANSVLLGNGTGGIATVAPGNVGNVLTSIGGVWVSNVAVSGAAAGSNTQVQYNNSGALGASANLTFDGTNLGLSGGTANGVAYLNGSKVLTTGSALTFDGTNLGLGVTPDTTWNSNAKAIQLAGFNAIFGYTSNVLRMANNAVFRSAGEVYGASSLGATYYQQYNGAHTWFNAPSGTAGNAIPFTQAMTLDASGNFFVGTTSQSGGSNITFNQSANADMKIAASASTATRATYQVFVNTTTSTFGTENSTGGSLVSGSSAYASVISNGGAYPIQFGTNNTVRATLDSSGNLLVGKTVADTSSAGVWSHNAGGGVGSINLVKTGTGTNSGLANYHSGTYVGGIDYSNTATVLVATSDQRLKQNIVEAPAAIEKVNSIEVVSYDWKHDPSSVQYGFVAQRLNNVYPEAVIQGDNGDEIEKTWGVEYGRLTPLLVKAIQEQQDMIQSLTDRIAQLETKP